MRTNRIDHSTKIRDQVFAGKAALDTDQKLMIFQSINQELEAIVEKDMFKEHPVLIQTWQEILAYVFPGQLAHDIAEHLDSQNYYKFGIYLDQLSNLEIETSNSLKLLMYAYLDIFRLSPFLKKIYGETKWEKLIYVLIQKSNFTVAALFNQRVKELCFSFS